MSASLNTQYYETLKSIERQNSSNRVMNLSVVFELTSPFSERPDPNNCLNVGQNTIIVKFGQEKSDWAIGLGVRGFNDIDSAVD